MGRAVGVEINDSRVKIITVESTAKRTRILSYHEEGIPVDPAKNWDDLAQEALKQAFATSRASKGRVVASIDSGDALLRDVTLPFKEDDKIRKTIHAEVESLVHNYTIEDLIVDYFKTGETEKGSVLMAAAVPKPIVEKRLRLLSGAGVDPVALDLDVSALFNTFLNAGAIDTDDPLLILYGTPKFTKILLVENKRPTSIRTIRFSLPTTEQIAHEKEERRQAAMWETKEVGHEIPIVVLEDTDHARFEDLDQESQNSLIGILAKEISRFLLANAASASPAQILISGEYETEEAAHLLEAATRIPVRTYNLLDVLEHPFKEGEPHISAKLAVPLGLALKGCEVDVLGMDFRKDKFSYSKKFETVKTTALVTLELFIVLLATVALHFHFKARDFRTLERQVMEYQLDAYRAVLSQEELVETDKKEEELRPKKRDKEREEFLRASYRKMQDYTTKMRRDLGDVHPLRDSAMEVWLVIGEATQAFFNASAKAPPAKLGEADLWLWIEKITINRVQESGKVRIDVVLLGRAATIEQAELFANSLVDYRQAGRPQPMFVRRGFSNELKKDPKDNKVPFTLNLQGEAK